MAEASSYEAFLKQFVGPKGRIGYDLRCVLRKRSVRATPEELVRQYVIFVLLERGYPRGLMNTERALSKGGRADLFVFDRNKKLYLLVECKRADQDLTHDDIMQLFRYSRQIRKEFLSLPAYMALCNGYYVYCICRDKPQAPHLKAFPPSPF